MGEWLLICGCWWGVRWYTYLSLSLQKLCFSDLCNYIKDTQVVSLRIVLDQKKKMCLVRDIHTRLELQICLFEGETEAVAKQGGPLGFLRKACALLLGLPQMNKCNFFPRIKLQAIKKKKKPTKPKPSGNLTLPFLFSSYWGAAFHFLFSCNLHKYGHQTKFIINDRV